MRWDFVNNEGFRWLFAAIVAPLTAFFWGLHQENVANTEAKVKYDLDRAQKTSSLVVNIFPYLADNDPASLKRDLALALLAQMRRDNNLAPELEASFQLIISRLTAKAEKNTATPDETRVLTEVAKIQDQPTLNAPAAKPAQPAVAQAAAPPSLNLPPRVYIQIFGSQDQKIAETARTNLQSNGILVPHIEDVTLNAQKGKQIPNGFREPTLIYFNAEDHARALAIAEQLEKAGVGRPRVADKPNTLFSVPVGQLELWFAKPGS